jgi:hypothetical protein
MGTISSQSAALLEATNEMLKANDALANLLLRILPLAEAGAAAGAKGRPEEEQSPQRLIELAKEVLGKFGPQENIFIALTFLA